MLRFIYSNRWWRQNIFKSPKPQEKVNYIESGFDQMCQNGIPKLPAKFKQKIWSRFWDPKNIHTLIISASEILKFVWKMQFSIVNISGTRRPILMIFSASFMNFCKQFLEIFLWELDQEGEVHFLAVFIVPQSKKFFLIFFCIDLRHGLYYSYWNNLICALCITNYYLISENQFSMIKNVIIFRVKKLLPPCLGVKGWGWGVEEVEQCLSIRLLKQPTKYYHCIIYTLWEILRKLLIPLLSFHIYLFRQTKIPKSKMVSSATRGFKLCITMLNSTKCSSC